jgi:hypothetical protein
VEHFLLARVQDVSGEDEAPESSSDKQAAESDGSHIAIRSDLTGIFCTSGSEREFTLEGSWYADQEIQAGADRDAAAAG